MTHIRRLTVDQANTYHPAYVVWELTLRCDQPCTHCGSRAGHARDREITTDEALAVVDRLAAMGAREVALIGGEAYLHEGFLPIVAALKRSGIRPTMTTGGRGITRSLADSMAAAGLAVVSVSLDGLEPTHDLMRAARGSFASATDSLRLLREAGISTGSNINLNRLNAPELEAVYEHVRRLGIVAWQVQITAPLGRAADRADMLLQPWDLLDVVPRVAALKQRAFEDGILLTPGNNLGFFGPEEAVLRSVAKGGQDHWAGCQAGRFVMGIESNGDVKGCPSLQSRHYVGGNLLRSRLEDIWNDAPQLAITRTRGIESLWGFCRTCVFAETCLGGCTFTAHSVLGRPGNNPYCHHRARTLARRGVRERLVPRERAPGLPFDNGLFELVEEALDAPDPRPDTPQRLVKIRRSRVG